jgi:hypothetical protein
MGRRPILASFSTTPPNTAHCVPLALIPPANSVRFVPSKRTSRSSMSLLLCRNLRVFSPQLAGEIRTRGPRLGSDGPESSVGSTTSRRPRPGSEGPESSVKPTSSRRPGGPSRGVRPASTRLRRARVRGVRSASTRLRRARLGGVRPASRRRRSGLDRCTQNGPVHGVTRTPITAWHARSSPLDTHARHCAGSAPLRAASPAG